MEEPLNVFVSYSLADLQMWKELRKYLHPFMRRGLILIWESNNNTYNPDLGRDEAVAARLDVAHLILLLISPDYLVSDYLYEIEMKQAIRRHQMGEALALPILLHPVHWQEEPFSILHMLPDNARPISLWSKKRVVFLQVSAGIREAIDQLHRRLGEERGRG